MNTTLANEFSDSKFSKNFFVNIKNLLNFITRIILYAVMTILIGAFVLFLLYFVDMLINVNKGNTKSPLFNAYIIISPSMVPTINVNDAIVIKRVNEGELKIDDIITFTSTDKKYSGLTITHRIVGTEKLQSGEVVYRTKGDANNVNDSALVSLDNIHGKVILRIPLIGSIQSILSTSSGWIFFIVIPCLGIISFDIFKLIKSVYTKKQLRKTNNIVKSKVNFAVNDNNKNIKMIDSKKMDIIKEDSIDSLDKNVEYLVEELNILEEDKKNNKEEEEIEFL